jgi:hypothetical protein
MSCYLRTKVAIVLVANASAISGREASAGSCGMTKLTKTQARECGMYLKVTCIHCPGVTLICKGGTLNLYSGPALPFHNSIHWLNSNRGEIRPHDVHLHASCRIKNNSIDVLSIDIQMGHRMRAALQL